MKKTMKKTMKEIVMMVAAVLLTGCTEHVRMNEMEDAVVAEKRVMFEVSNGDWNITRALEADGVTMTDLWVFDYVGDELVRTAHKVSADADFSSPSMSLQYGEHTLYFVASRGKTPTIDGTEITWAQPSDTFWKAVSVNVGSSSSSVVPVTLDRVATKLRVAVTDEVPEGVTQICVTPDVWWYGVDYMTGAAILSQEIERSIAVPASYIGTTGQLVVNVFGMSDSDEWTTDVTITAKDGDGNVVGVVALDDVPFERNRATNVSGSLFVAGTTFSVSLNDVWTDSYDLEW
jgi:hypothetical protein